jgi:hypothetical protein
LLTFTLAPILPAATSKHTLTQVPQNEKMFCQMFTDEKFPFYTSSDGTSTFIKLVMLGNVDQGVAVYCGLNYKSTGRITDWDQNDMRPSGGNKRAFTFAVDLWG